ncbi:extracellular solute-binding protein [Micromonospora sp. WMMA1363]|uniref:extracellular solute-binding protein n=1 Tax=Micromonospora sp. WMMA1363 TaxID=3053985 RepID=UPI00259CBDC6|nr:extracellular solute-binding protein [Micromonospora sp. WMMA1363]MDM4719633.1 extracellular solute-binding protein [Micromonospora sp. WMMA1363]
MTDVVVDAWLADLTFPNYMDSLHQLARRFEAAHPGYQVRIRGLHFEEIASAADRAAAEGQMPAIVEYYYTSMPDALDARDRAKRPVFIPVERAVAGRAKVLDEPVVLDDLHPALRAQYTWQGELYSLPTVVTSFHLFANVTLLRAAGVTEIPRTWQQLRAACEQVARAPGGPPHAITWANNGIPFQHAVAVQGGTIADHDNGRSGPARTLDFTTDEMIAWVQWWRELHADGLYVYTGEPEDWFGTFELFAGKRVAFRLSSSNDIAATAQAAKANGFELAVADFPYNADTPYAGNVVAGTSLWLADGLEPAVRDGALAFMQFLASPRNSADYHKAHSFVPVTRSAYRLLDEEGWFAEHPYHQAPNRQMDRWSPRRPATGALIGRYFEIQQVMTRAMHDVLLTDAQPRDRFAEATVEAQRMLDEYHARHAGPALVG